MPCFNARKSLYSKYRAGRKCFPTFFSFKLDQSAREREEDVALTSPLCHWLLGQSLSASCPDAQFQDTWF